MRRSVPGNQIDPGGESEAVPSTPSDRTFLKFFAPRRLAAGELADVEFGVIKVRPGYAIENVQRALKQALPASVA